MVTRPRLPLHFTTQICVQYIQLYSTIRHLYIFMKEHKIADVILCFTRKSCAARGHYVFIHTLVLHTVKFTIHCTYIVYRLYDVFLTSPPLMPVYMSAAIVLHRKREIMAVECELSSVHQVLHRLPQDLPLDMLVSIII